MSETRFYLKSTRTTQTDSYLFSCGHTVVVKQRNEARVELILRWCCEKNATQAGFLRNVVGEPTQKFSRLFLSGRKLNEYWHLWCFTRWNDLSRNCSHTAACCNFVGAHEKPSWKCDRL